MAFWTDKEIKILTKKYPEQGSKIIELQDIHTTYGIQLKARNLGIKYKHYTFRGHHHWTKQYDSILIKNYSRKGSNIQELKDKDFSKYAIQHRARQLGLKYIHKNVKITKKLKSILDGLLISDAWLEPYKKTARLGIKQAKKTKKWLDEITILLENNGIMCYSIKPLRKEKNREIIGIKVKAQQHFIMRTKYYIELFNERKRWYPKGEKTIPNDIILSPHMIALWYMGDGSITKVKNRKDTYQIVLTTTGFDEKEVIAIKESLNNKYKMNFKPYSVSKDRKKDRKGLELRLIRRNDIYKFLKLTFPYRISCFDYKWKPVLST